ncbi:MAG: DUF1499 domain-containing protein [Gemmatimonadetes bacterium]|uniref:DUF1499 domain-containing protein n=1 Tax=Candidatus Kutchimonas denitrificans TaxID=3056748 RepID=A0AAE4ZCT8_9BACT|nr:DUF1499 domain-containing protein [Gemmatimonadota bacterium]NIR75490.1 DUF1499 domain-containing protein [Candidatus Kutchimonas denitrificans]NIS01804.1 DUF1499 domain-containing protein [Gemmatimonadota bacterium]NIT67585.1 DUF1499 domain-containing protein [Gemmatimonadota bacterium]NIU53459.1 DUF1499 domain-containing protein [Gemmatimonadota bacterium]
MIRRDLTLRHAMRSRLIKALTENSAQTSEDAEDPRLRGRTYMVPFARVWDEVIEMIRERPRWNLVRANEDKGLIGAEATTPVFRFVDDVRLKIRLDANALTRVDMWSQSRVGNADLGVNTRRIGKFFRDLDRRLGVDG